MPPLEYGCPHRGTGFKHERRLASPQQMSSGSKPDRACADDGNWQVNGLHIVLAFIYVVLQQKLSVYNRATGSCSDWSPGDLASTGACFCFLPLETEVCLKGRSWAMRKKNALVGWNDCLIQS